MGSERRVDSKLQRLLTDDLEKLDPESSKLSGLEDARQQNKIIMIASESIAPEAVKQALATNFTNIYAEGYPAPRMTEDKRDLLMDIDYQMAYQRRYSDRRYYKGCEYANFTEALAQKRVRKLFANDRVPFEKLYANVQPLSGAAANNAVYQAFCRPGDTVMGLELSHGGHLTHGSPHNRSGKLYNIVSYQVSPSTGRLDYDAIRSAALEVHPRMLIAGFSAYPWSLDWQKLREICDETGTILYADIAHTAGLIAAGVVPSPVGYAQAIGFTTHKTMCGPRGAVILTDHAENAARVNGGVFPGEQGGPHINSIFAKAVIFKLAAQPAFKQLMADVQTNCQVLAQAFLDEDMRLAYGGTDTHLCLVDLKTCKCSDGSHVDGEIASRVLDLAGIVVNKNTTAGDENAAHPSAIRFGTTWVTQLGYGPDEMKQIASCTAALLRSVRPFCYFDIIGKLGRGKLDLDLLFDITKKVDRISGRFRRLPKVQSPLLDRYKNASLKMRDKSRTMLPASFGDPEKEIQAAETGCALIDISGHGLLEITGANDRVQAFLQQSGTADMSKLDKNRVRRTFYLNGDAQILDDAIVVGKLNKDPLRKAFFVVSNPESKEHFQAWVRGLSDGYSWFDHEDYYAKVEGPVTVRDLAVEEDLRLIGLLGPKAVDVAAKIFPIAKAIPDGKILRPTKSETKVFRSDVLDQVRVYLVVPGNEFETVYDKLRKVRGVTEAGQDAWEKTSRNRRMVTWRKGKLTEAKSYVENPDYREWFDFTKNYFVGQTTLKEFCTEVGSKVEWSFTPTDSTKLLRTPLYQEHLKLGKKSYMVPFAGWKMPVRYGSIVAEHLAVRERCGLFDVAHMGVIEISGKYATRFLDTVFSNYAAWTESGQSMYGYLLDANGICIDDCLIYRREPERYMMVCNAGNKDKVWDWLNAVNSGKVIIDHQFPSRSVDGPAKLRDLKDPAAGKDQRVDLALQGPRALDVILTCAGDDPHLIHTITELPRTGFVECELGGINVILSRTGYTGEQIAFELYVHPDDAVKTWRMLMKNGEEYGIAPCGLAARDSLRTEAGLPLYGHELTGPLDIGPGGAGYAAYVKLHKPFFVGKAPFMEQEAKRKMALIRFQIISSGSRKLNPGDRVLDRRGKVIGAVTSCTLTGEGQIGMAYVSEKYKKPGSRLGIIPSPRDENAIALKKPSELWVGDNIVLHEEAQVLPRFMG
jgi:glycine cleavage system T protein